MPEKKITEPKSDVDEIRNISLFSHRQPDEPLLLEEKVSQEIDTSQIAMLALPEDVTVPQLEENPSVLSEQNSPLENIQTAVVSPTKSSVVSTDLAFASEITLDPEEINQIEENQKHVDSGVVYADISDTLSEIPSVTEEKPSDQPSFQTASLVNDEIPLSEKTGVMHEYIDVSATAAADQIAMVEPTALINTIDEDDLLKEEKTLAEANLKNKEISDMFDISNSADVDDSAWQVAQAVVPEGEFRATEENNAVADSPWVMAKGNKFAKNQAVVEEFNQKEKLLNEQNEAAAVAALKEAQKDEDIAKEDPLEEPLGEENLVLSLNQSDQENIEQALKAPLLKEKTSDTKLAYQMIQNILIPIPEDILNDADLTPDLTSSPEEKDLSQTLAEGRDDSLQEKDKQTGLFKSISSWFAKNKDQNSDESTQIIQDSKKLKHKSSSKKNFFSLGDVSDIQVNTQTSIMPAELRLSFQPNRAEISGQTLKWIYAFADNARDNDNVYVEVRVDGTSSYVLQQKRLNLLSSIFSTRGVDYRKINIIFTSREPNSFIIRNIRFNNKEGKGQNLE